MSWLSYFLDYRKLENQTLYAILLAVFLGAVYPNFVDFLKPIGDIFLRLLKTIAIPLVMASIFVSIVSLGSFQKLKDLGIKALIYYTATTFLAVLTGLIITNILFQGGGANITETAKEIPHHNISLQDFFVSFFPENIFESLSEGKVIQIIVFTLIFALAVLKIGNQQNRETIVRFFEGFNEAKYPNAQLL